MTADAGVFVEVAELERSTPDGSGHGDWLVVTGWEREQWATLLSYTQPVELEAGEALIQARESDRALFFVTSGRLEVAATSERDGSVSQLASVSAGSVVGELAFLDGGPRSARAWAVTPSRLRRLAFEDYERYASAHASDAAALLFAIARLLGFRLRKLTARL